MYQNPAKSVSKYNDFSLSRIMLYAGFSIFLAIMFFLLPTPVGLQTKTWHLFAIFVITIVGIMANIAPLGMLAILAIAASTLSGILTIKQALSGFSSNIIWLIFIAFILAKGFIKTGLGARIAYYFLLRLGKSTIGLGYGLVITEFILAPFTPSNTARGGGIVYPIVHALCKEYDSTPAKNTQRKIGSYLMKLGYQANVITTAMFLTAGAGNSLIVSLALQFQIEISWKMWMFAGLVPGIFNLLLLPWLIKLIYPPEIKHTPEASNFARLKLKEMGPLNRPEWIMLITFSLLLILWIFGPALKVDPTVAALVGLSILLITEVLNWDDILQENNAWDIYIWLGTLMMMSNHLTEFGFVAWFSGQIENLVGNFHWIIALSIVSLIYFYTHYIFASISAHISSMFTAFAIVAITLGAPPVMVVLLLGFLSSLCAGITHYGTGTGPVYFGAGYIKLSDWLRIGGIMSVINICIWVVIGISWWKLIGLC